ncbi:MAG: hypothetical protein HOI34_16410 [Rhodospirillaceae bacterium]|nr:hypothetical protein [Rhodospirillaceae bacterium]MBT6205263.1 hypothetical protein [Rhodospirillaceae bacterium]MBT6511943.1 hypothetical protein [Rhodospirillaceae bacterium]MBT7614345.1 hypothetical protein [Rhodospirillaceae bacterium]MBT7648797.1 hypothetical protein [Rhodospirillaceae bacterium]
MPDRDTQGQAGRSPEKVDAKAERLAEALRANLKRRKIQARERVEPEDSENHVND